MGLNIVPGQSTVWEPNSHKENTAESESACRQFRVLICSFKGSHVFPSPWSPLVLLGNPFMLSTFPEYKTGQVLLSAAPS